MGPLKSIFNRRTSRASSYVEESDDTLAHPQHPVPSNSAAVKDMSGPAGSMSANGPIGHYGSTSRFESAHGTTHPSPIAVPATSSSANAALLASSSPSAGVVPLLAGRDPSTLISATSSTKPNPHTRTPSASFGRRGVDMSTLPPVPSGKENASSMLPDTLTRAFHEVIRPYTDRIEQLESQLADQEITVKALKRERAEIHDWIDKRGLRPDVPHAIASSMDASSPDAAATLNAQLDRKVTIVNFDLHRLQDDLNDTISASHFAAAMAKFLPDIARLASLPSGPRYAFDLILKLGGNLNSHGGLADAAAAAAAGDEAAQDDLASQHQFFTALDQAMVDIVRRRFAEGEPWSVPREIKRIEKVGACLRDYGVEPYFPVTLELMHSGEKSGYGGTNSQPQRY